MSHCVGGRGLPGRCLVAVWSLSGRCLGAVWALSGRCLGRIHDFWGKLLSGCLGADRCLTAVWAHRCLRGCLAVLGLVCGYS
jgi:hypothetical protein